MKAAIITFHATPNYGATLQCYALSSFLQKVGASVEVVNYAQPHNLWQYFKSSFLGKRRSVQNFARIEKFWRFCRDHLSFSGAPILSRAGLTALQRRYDIAFTGSDEVWKIDHMRKLDPSFYLDFCDRETTRICSYAASASTVTDLRKYASAVNPLLARFDGLAVRDPYTRQAVIDLTQRNDVVEVVDPTLLIDWSSLDLQPILDGPYLALYSWLDARRMAHVRSFADRNGLRLVSVGCQNPGSDLNLLSIGPLEWLRLIRHSQCVVTDFFHGLVFSILFERPFFAHVDKAKKLKLEHILGISGLEGRLHADTAALAFADLMDLNADWPNVRGALQPQREFSRAWLVQQLRSCAPR